MIHILNDTGGSDQINSIRYEGELSDKQNVKFKRSTPLIKIDYRSIIPEPPVNSSDLTKIDLEQVQRLTRNLSRDDIRLVEIVDEDTEDLFKPYVKRMGLLYPQDLIDISIDHIDTALLQLKYKFRRPRPIQIAAHLGYVISVINTDTHQTPAYPSGHQAQASIVAEILSSLHPEHKSKFYEFSRLAGKARVMQGVHYPSDNEASVTLVRILWEDMKKNLDDKWTNLIKE